MLSIRYRAHVVAEISWPHCDGLTCVCDVLLKDCLFVLNAWLTSHQRQYKLVPARVFSLVVFFTCFTFCDDYVYHRHNKPNMSDKPTTTAGKTVDLKTAQIPKQPIYNHKPDLITGYIERRAKANWSNYTAERRLWALWWRVCR